MAEQDEKKEIVKGEIFEKFLEEKNLFADLISENLVGYFKEEKKPELELIEIYVESFTNAVENAGKELKLQYRQSDNETLLLINKHIENTSIITMLSKTNSMLKKKKGILGFLEKILPILEIIKKLITQIIELFPKFLEKILKKIILPILELIDNIIKQVLELFGSKSASKYLKIAERDFLETHPLWRKLQFDTLDTTEEN